MTQTITNCNEVPAGKTYPVADLRTAESIEQLCAYVDAGHPVASTYGFSAKCLRRNLPDTYDYDKFDGNYYLAQVSTDVWLLNNLKLAPIAYKDGRPLHVGDDIVVMHLGGGDAFDCKIGTQTIKCFNFHMKLGFTWRFASQLEDV